MGILDLATHSAVMPATGASALIAAWLTWRIWRRLFRVVIMCLAVGLVVYLAFPDVAQRFPGELHTPTTSNTGVQ